MHDVPVGPALTALVSLAYRSGRPVLLHGAHGVGKSECLKGSANVLGIDFIVRDLSLMEPPDLIGIPQVGPDGRTHYFPPSFLPAEGAGLLVLEELNRCPRYMQAPCLQLLTERRLNDYVLPPGWLPCAAVNEAGEGYIVDDLDVALRSRFIEVRCVASAEAWLPWARQHDIHPTVVAFVESAPSCFEDPHANPRAWSYVSAVLHLADRENTSDADLLPVLVGLLKGEQWAVHLLEFRSKRDVPVPARKLLKSYPAHRGQVHAWVSTKRLDLVERTTDLLMRHLQPQRVYDAFILKADEVTNAKAFLTDVPAELRRRVRAWAKERGFKELGAIP